MKRVENGQFLAKMASLEPYFLAKMDNFWQKVGKPIALLFGQNMVILGTLLICARK